ncbi:MAG: PepSY-associated TM helix domain-containing protein [Luteolibacter sp.]
MNITAKLRKANYRFHAWVGYLGAWFLILIGLTGSVLVFEKEISSAIHPGWHEVMASGKNISLDEIDSKLRATYPEHMLTGFRLPQGKTESLQASLLREGIFSMAYVSPSDGEFLGLSTPHWRHILLKAHNALVLGDWGMAVLFFIACCMILLGSSGLWMQRNLLKNLFRRPRFARSPRLGFTDLHKMCGVPISAFLILLGTTGALYNWPSFGKIAAGKADKPGFATSHRTHQAAKISLEKAVARARASIPDFSPSYVSFPRNGDGRLRVFGSVPGQSFFGIFASSVEIDAADGKILGTKDIRNLPWQMKWRSFIRPLHYGNFGGIPVKIIYSLSSLCLVALSITGLGIRSSRMKRHPRP